MKLQTKYVHSKLARRIVWLFVLCALLPVTVFAVVSFWSVAVQVNKQSRRQLRQMSHEEGMSIVERLNFLEADLKLMASEIRSSRSGDEALLASGLYSHLKGRFDGLEVVTSAGQEQLLFGKVHAKLDLDTNEKAHLRSGKSLLNTKPCNQPAPCILLSRSLDDENPGEKILLAEVHAAYLWDAENVPNAIDLCVRNERDTTLFCSGEEAGAVPAESRNAVSGQFEWKQGDYEYVADYWKLFLKPTFFTPQWTVLASEAKADILSPLSAFKRSFALTFLLALWVVLLLSLVQIRRNLVPLRQLQLGTRRIASGDFQWRVATNSHDEFEELAGSFNSMAKRIDKQISSLRMINEIDRAILSAWEIEQIVDAVITLLPTLLSYDFVSICLLDPHNPALALTYVAAVDPGAPRNVNTTEFTEEEARSLSAQREIQTLEYKEPCPHHLLPLAACGVTYFLVVPIFLKDKLCAIISLGHAEEPSWSETDKPQLRQIADQMAVAISNARLVGELRQLHLGTLTALARAIDAKSPWTSGHSERVTNWALRIAAALNLPKEELDIIHRGGLLHDIGKIGIPAYVLDKPGKLTPGELQQMREHVSIGARILEPVPGFTECMPIIWQHHEWINGSGYPKGLAGDEISLHARIFAVADCFDALISDRPYRAGLSRERALEIILEGSGTQFDPAVIKTFVKLLDVEPGKNQPSGALVETR